MDTEQQGAPPASSPPANWILGEGLLREVVTWSIVVSALGGLVGWLLTTEIAFALALWLGAAIDITTFRELVKRGQGAMQDERERNFGVAALLVRLIAKGAVLVVAALLGSPAAFWGAVFGVLVVELMLVVVGIVRSIGMMRGLGGGTGRGVQP